MQKYLMVGTNSYPGGEGIVSVQVYIDTEGTIEIQDAKYDWVSMCACLSKEQMAEVGRFLLEASECG